jgi:hypothetical protein
MNGKYDEALDLMRASVRNNAYDANALNDLGVTEMRMGQLQSAKRRFWRCLHIDETNEDCTRNAEELRRYVGDEDYGKGAKEAYPQTHHIEAPRVVPATDLLDLGLDSGYAKELLSKPFIVKEALQQWGWKGVGERQFLAEMTHIHPRAPVEFYPQGMSEETCSPFFAGLQDSYDWFFDPVGSYAHVDASEPGTIIQWNMSPDLWHEVLQRSSSRTPLPQIFKDSWWKGCTGSADGHALFDQSTHWKMLIAGERHSGMFNHKDYLPTASFQVQLEGRKAWHICSPDQEAYMYEAGDVDAFKPDYDYFPEFAKASCYQVTLTPGDLIYYPENYWHQTLNLDTPSVSLSSSLLRDTNFESVGAHLRDECRGKGAIFAPNEQLCTALRVCHATWMERYPEEEEL